MFLNLFISNAGLLVIAMGETIVMITAGIDISVGSVTALVCMVAANQMENHGASAYTALLMALVIGLLFGLVQGFLVSYLEIQPFIVTLAAIFVLLTFSPIISALCSFPPIAYTERPNFVYFITIMITIRTMIAMITVG